MPFPKSHDKVFVFEPAELPDDFFLRLLKEIMQASYQLDREGEKLCYKSRKSVGGFVCKVSFDFETKGGGALLAVSVQLEKLLNVILAVILLASLTSAFSVGLFIVFSALFSAVFYFLNISLVLSEVSAFVKKAKGEVSEEIMGGEQIEWLNDPEKCPACGSEINHYSWKCHSCGLQFGRKLKTERFNTSAPRLKFTYSYKPKDD